MARYSSLPADELVKACAGSNDPALWEEFIRRFRPVISKVVLRTSRHWGDPTPQLLDDLIQDTYLKLCDDDSRLLRSFESRHEDAIYGFLKTVAANVVRDHFKALGAEKRGTEKTDPLIDESRVALDAGNGLGPVERRILLDQIDEILHHAMSDDDQQRNRSIFWLHHRQGLSASDIASMPGIGLSTKGVETALRRMKLMIRSHVLENQAGENAVST